MSSRYFVPIRHISNKFKKQHFFDKLRIYVKGGAGGQGFPKYGGIGGKGGDVIVRAIKRTNFRDLVETNPTKRYTAGTGQNSRKTVLLGDPGNDHIIAVPVGVTITTDEGRVLGDLDEEEDECIVARGGKPGGPNNNYLGKRGEAHSVTLDLKLIADIGLVGFPNAGKSTFLSAISKAQPKIAEYPFTTIRPQIGTIQFPDLRQITVADLPGLIEGAHENFGMGHKFLKHVERTKLLLFMVDIEGFQLKTHMQRRDAFETILLLNKELELYNKQLLNKPAVIALNKIDNDPDCVLTDSIVDKIKRLPDSLSEVDESIRPESLMKFSEIYKISTMFDLNIETVKKRLRGCLDTFAEQENIMAGFDREQMKLIEQQEQVLGREQLKKKLI